MNKLQKLKAAMASPPPDRLAKIEYRSHFMQMLGVSIVCIVLLLKGFWYIIFAFIFSLGISYSQGMTAYMKYKNISRLMGKEDPLEFDSDISPTRRRTKIIKYVFNDNAHWASVVATVGVSFMIIGTPGWIKSLAYLILIPLVYGLIYFFGFYWLAYPIYKKEVLMK